MEDLRDTFVHIIGKVNSSLKMDCDTGKSSPDFVTKATRELSGLEGAEIGQRELRHSVSTHSQFQSSELYRENSS
jgi:hypothetical protein